MKKGIFSVLSLSLFLLVLLLPNQTISAQTITSLPPSNYLQSGRYQEGTVKDVYYYSSETKSQRKMVVYTPPGYTTSKKYPVIYGIHGINSWPSTIFDDWCVNADVIANNLIGEGAIEPCIIVAMDNNNVNSHNELLNVVIPYVEKNYSVIADADHRGIYGYSMGGGVAFAEGIGNLDVFHHVCPTSALPANHPSDAQMFPNGGAIAKQKLKTLVLSCGTIDWCGFYPSNLATHNYCEANNIPHYWLSVEGGNHDAKVWSPAMYYFLKYAFPKNGSSQSGGEIETPVSSAPVTVPGETAKIADGYYYIKNVNAEKYLQVADAAGKAGQNVEISSKTGSEAQKWYLKNLDNGYITISSALGEFMIDIDNGSDADCANVQIYHGYSGDAQQFVLKTASTENAYFIATKASQVTKVLDANGAGKTDGTNVIQYTFNGNKNQLWIFEKADVSSAEQTEDGKLDASYSINSWGSGYQVSFKISNNSSEDVSGWTLKVKKSDINISSSWNVEIDEDDTYYIITPLSWNSNIAKGNSVEFGVQGEGTIGTSIDCSLE